MWLVVSVDEDSHVIPKNDIKDHDLSRTCWCNPRQDVESPVVVIHNSLDRRETFETKKALAN